MPYWVKIELIRKPYYDADGNILESITGMKNRPGIDEFSGGGTLRPDLSGFTILESYDRFDVWLVCVDENPSDLVNTIGIFSYQASPKTKLTYDFEDFNIMLIQDQAAELLKTNFYRAYTE